MRRLSLLLVAVATALAVSLSAMPRASAQEGAEAKIGYLNCQISSGWGIVFGSSRDRACTFTPIGTGEVEHYKGTINKFGADIGYLQSGVILWTVVAPANTAKPGALAGHYAGATASVTPGLGVGVHALIGGMENSISLQPVSIEGNAGLNVAAGVATMHLDPAPQS